MTVIAYAAFGIMVALVLATWMLQQHIASSRAAIAPTPCPGNVCTFVDSMTLTENPERYAYAVEPIFIGGMTADTKVGKTIGPSSETRLTVRSGGRSRSRRR